jgi:hypothetical protein
MRRVACGEQAREGLPAGAYSWPDVLGVSIGEPAEI